MSEYIIEWSGIGARIVELIGSVPTYLIPKRLREERLREPIVRCRDCRYYDQNDEPSEVYPDRYFCDLMANFLHPDGFCAWGERADNFATCKCGEDIELGNRESAVCPRCNRTVIA